LVLLLLSLYWRPEASIARLLTEIALGLKSSLPRLRHLRDTGVSCGAHWFARDPRGPWKLAPEPGYSSHVELVNGSDAHYQTRQRPQMVFAEACRRVLG